MRFVHKDVQILNRSVRIIIDRQKDSFYIYDPDTALFAELKEQVGKDILNEKFTSSVEEVLITFLTLEEKNKKMSLNLTTDASSILAISLGTRTDCNMSCTYCYNNNHFEKNGRKDIFQMDHHIAMNVIESALCLLHDNDVLSVQFIGGEPLLDFESVKKIIIETEARALSINRSVRFSINTNGTLLDKKKAVFLNEHKVSIYISIDGSKEQHDKHRIFKDGSGSYMLIARKLKEFLETYDGTVRTCRITASSKNFDFIEAVKSCIELGFNNIATGIPFSNILQSVEMEEGETIVNELLIGIKKLRQYCIEQYKMGAAFRLGIFHNTMFHLYAYRPQMITCGAIRRYVAVSPNGEIVPCHRYLGTTDKTKIIGNIDNIGTSNPLNIEQRNSFIMDQGFDDFGDVECSKCWVKRLCGGMCYEVGEEMKDNDQLKHLICKFKKGLIAEVMEMYVEIQEIPELFNYVMTMNSNLRSDETAQNSFAEKMRRLK
ncbi:radical SAM/SPASM domain-containing protein [Paenibacillus sp. YN15]|uniref:radical SAM/SPASM domain-containing protein n=1 Tax=Paenibacillus sp. YN15 TaxID=1742774 RepID=UPI0015EB55F0|nr:radical SAM protein [Paenibacillus sp. YN15]